MNFPTFPFYDFMVAVIEYIAPVIGIWFSYGVSFLVVRHVTDWAKDYLG